MPLHTSTTFERGGDGTFSSGFEYIRGGNPTRNAFEAAMASLEGGSTALAFSSGMAAITAVFEGHATEGRIVVPDDMYFGIRSLIEETDIGRRFEFVAVDMRDLDTLRATVTDAPTSLVWIETPSNPLIRVVDIRAVSQIAHEAGALVVVDSTWATPVLQRPLELGADAVMHSATKYIGGRAASTKSSSPSPPRRSERLPVWRTRWAISKGSWTDIGAGSMTLGVGWLPIRLVSVGCSPLPPISSANAMSWPTSRRSLPPATVSTSLQLTTRWRRDADAPQFREASIFSESHVLDSQKCALSPPLQRSEQVSHS
ncbi:aminotransferase class I/II-fold pyridoxal phosphate-dependent enzyme [Mesorhizobium sp. A556]